MRFNEDAYYDQYQAMYDPQWGDEDYSDDFFGNVDIEVDEMILERKHDM